MILIDYEMYIFSAPLKVGQPPEKKTKSLAPNPVNPLLKSANEASVIDKIKGNASANEGRGRIKIIPAKPRRKLLIQIFFSFTE